VPRRGHIDRIARGELAPMLGVWEIGWPGDAGPIMQNSDRRGKCAAETTGSPAPQLQRMASRYQPRPLEAPYRLVGMARKRRSPAIALGKRTVLHEFHIIVYSDRQ
jgi:hypothetical protein